jgi:hypothetical protein
MQELMLGTINESSQIVINNTPTEMFESLSIDDTAAVAQYQTDLSDDYTGAECVQHQHNVCSDSGGGAEAMQKKSFMRKKEMSANVDDGGKQKQQKQAKVASARK